MGVFAAIGDGLQGGASLIVAERICCLELGAVGRDVGPADIAWTFPGIPCRVATVLETMEPFFGATYLARACCLLAKCGTIFCEDAAGSCEPFSTLGTSVGASALPTKLVDGCGS